MTITSTPPHTTSGTRSARRITAEQAAALVKNGDWVDLGSILAQPNAFDRALAARLPELEGLKVRTCISSGPRAMLAADPDAERMHFYSWHFGGYDRAQSDAGRVHYMPCQVGEVSEYYRRFIERPDVYVLRTRPMDEHGWFDIGISNAWHGTIAEVAKVVVVEVDPRLPKTHGERHAIHVSDVDFIIDAVDAPLPELPQPPVTDVDRAVAGHIASELEDGACLQIGIGAMPNAVCTLLLETGIKDLGVHTEMLTDGIVDLYRAGVVNGSRKNCYPGKVVYAFALGSQRSYDTVHDNPDFWSLPAEETNKPSLIAANDRMVSINNTTQMDLQGQAASESSGHRHISGTGGQLQFVRGAYESQGGKSFICLSSTYERHGERRSRIVTELTPGNVVTTPRSDIMYVATEYGVVNLKGKSVPDRVRAMISLAHPDFRDELSRSARANGLLERHTF